MLYDPDGAILSNTRWNTLRSFIGHITVGGSIVIENSILPESDTELKLLIILHIGKSFYSSTVQETYDINLQY